MTSKESLREMQRSRIRLAQNERQKERQSERQKEHVNSPAIPDTHSHAEHRLRERLEVFFAQLFPFLMNNKEMGESDRVSKSEQHPAPLPVTRRRWAAFAPHGHEPQLHSALQAIARCFQVDWVFPRVLNPESEVPDMEFYLPHAGGNAERSEADPVSVASHLGPNADSMRASAFKDNSWGLSEPNPETSELIDGETIEGFLIPALAFDMHGARLGRGKGYFDKYLSRFADVHSLSETVSETVSETFKRACSLTAQTAGVPSGHQTKSAPDSAMPAAFKSGLKFKTKIGIAFDDQILSENLVTEAHDITMDIVLSESRLLVSQAWWKHHSENGRGTRIAFRQAFPGAELIEASPLKTTAKQLKGLKS